MGYNNSYCSTMSECNKEGIDMCRNGCCRSFAGTQFCDMESNCLDYPTWIVALVPIMLGLAALILLIIVIYRIKSRKVVDRYTFIREQSERAQSRFRSVPETERNFNN